MGTPHHRVFMVPVAAALIIIATACAQDPLPSWRDGPTKQAIVTFVARVTQEGSPDFVPQTERIATFDNDGTLWSEQPMHVQLRFALERVKTLAPQHPEWKDKEPFASLLKGDSRAALTGGERSILEIVMATHAGMTTEEFERVVKEWLATSQHPRFQRRYTECVYQPMLELLAYLLRAVSRPSSYRVVESTSCALDRKRLWRAAGTSCRQQHQDHVRNAGRQACADATGRVGLY